MLHYKNIIADIIRKGRCVNMPTKQQKRAVIKQLLIPVVLIIAALLYQPVMGWIHPEKKEVSTPVANGNLKVCYIDVGQGDATLISKGQFHMLIDAGKNEMGNKVVKYLKDEKIDKLDVLVGTHPDSDHIGGLDDVLKNIDVSTVYLPDAKKTTKTYGQVEQILSEKNQKMQMPEIGKSYTYDDNVVIRFLGPDRNYKDANDNSLVVQLAYGKNHFLFMGDAEEIAENDIIKQGYDLECDVLKVGHHGSYTATSNIFLEQTNPTYAVISCGQKNSYGHPHAEVVSKLEDDDVQIYRTDRMGTIVATSDGEKVSMTTEKK